MNAMKGRWRRSNSRSFPCFELSGSGLPIRCSRLLRQGPRTLRIAGAQPPEYFYYSKTHESYSGKEFEPSQCKICSLKIYSFCQGQVSGSVEEDEVVCICCREPERYARRCNVFDRVEARVSLSNLEGGELLTVHDKECYSPRRCFLNLPVEGRGVFEIVCYLEELGWEKVES